MLIGVDQYQSVDLEALEGAVADTLSVCDYLHEKLHVPLNQIAILHNETATRTAIIQQLHLLRKRHTLHGGDPILIFFAGHGAQAKAPPNWTTKTYEMLCPHDFIPETTKGIVGQGISDIAFGAQLRDLAKEKGDNIVRCHIT